MNLCKFELFIYLFFKVCGAFVRVSPAAAAASSRTCLHIRCTAAATQWLSAAPAVPLGHLDFDCYLLAAEEGGNFLNPCIPRELPVLVCALVCLVGEM